MAHLRKWIIFLCLLWLGLIILLPYSEVVGIYPNSVDVFPYYDWRIILIGFYPVLLGYWLAKLKCESCGADQVLRGLHITEFRLPGNECWNCGTNLINKPSKK